MVLLWIRNSIARFGVVDITYEIIAMGNYAPYARSLALLEQLHS